MRPRGHATCVVVQAAKSVAMGPRHVTSGLAAVLCEPMLSTVTAEAEEAAASGWFWNIRQLSVRVGAAAPALPVLLLLVLLPA